MAISVLAGFAGVVLRSVSGPVFAGAGAGAGSGLGPGLGGWRCGISKSFLSCCARSWLCWVCCFLSCRGESLSAEVLLLSSGFTAVLAKVLGSGLGGILGAGSLGVRSGAAACLVLLALCLGADLPMGGWASGGRLPLPSSLCLELVGGGCTEAAPSVLDCSAKASHILSDTSFQRASWSSGLAISMIFIVVLL